MNTLDVIREHRAELRDMMYEFQKELDQCIVDDINVTINNIGLQVSKMKNPYLQEVLTSLKGQELEPKYTASDILTVLENIEEYLEIQKVKNFTKCD